MSQDGVSCYWGNCFKAKLQRIILCWLCWDLEDHRVHGAFAGGAYPQALCWDSVLAGTLLAAAAE